MAAAEKHNRCVVDAGRFHYPVIDIPPDTICPRCDLIFNDTAELQRRLASVEYPPPEGHSSVTNAETSVGACGSDLWHKIRDRWKARRAERETKTHQTAAWRNEGRRDDGEHELGAEGIWQGRQQEHGREAAQRRVEDALRTFSASVGSHRRSLHVLDDKARGARVQETEREIARLLGTGGDQGHDREHIRGALGQTRANRLLGQAPSGALERALSAEMDGEGARKCEQYTHKYSTYRVAHSIITFHHANTRGSRDCTSLRP